MPSSTRSRKSAAGGGSIRKKCITRNGKEYWYWEARVSVGFDPGTGKQIQKSITGQTQKEVRLKMQEMIRQVDAGSYKEPCKLTLAQWLDMWTAEYLNNLKRLTQEQYRMQCTYYLKPCLGAAKLSALNTHMIQQFINSLSNGERAELSAKTIKNIYGVLHKALNQAVENEFISHNPASACKLPKIKKPPIHPLEPEEITRLITAAQDDDYGNLFVSAIFTGMRQGELLGLTWDNVNFDTGTITVKQQLQCKDGVYFLQTPKNGKGRVIVPAQVTMDALRDEKERQVGNQQIYGECWHNPENYVFTDMLGKHLVRRTIVKHFRAVSDRAGIKNVRFHDLRHSFAVNSLMIGDDVKTVQANLGHATASFTLDVYGHVTQKMKNDSAERMQQFFNAIRVT